MSKFLRDTRTVFIREILPTLRDPYGPLLTLVQPLIFLGLFGPLLGGIMSPGEVGAESTLQWFVPGVLVMIALFGTGAVGYGLLTEVETGSYERMLVSPLNRSALLVGKSLKEMAPLMVQAAVILLVLLPFGFRAPLAPVLLGLALLGLFGVGLGALSYALAISVRHQPAMFWGVQTTLQFPLLILSGMMLPLETGPAWMRAVAAFNPLRYVVDAERALFAGQVWVPEVGWGLLATLLLGVVGLALGIRAIRHSGV